MGDKLLNIIYEKLIKNGVIECDSPKHRKLIYTKLESNNIKFKKRLIGYTNGKKTMESMCRGGGNAKRLLKMIINKRVQKCDLKKSLWCEAECFSNKNIDILFDNKSDYSERLNILSNQLDDNLGSYGQWRFIPIKKKIIEIKLI